MSITEIIIYFSMFHIIHNRIKEVEILKHWNKCTIVEIKLKLTLPPILLIIGSSLFLLLSKTNIFIFATKYDLLFFLVGVSVGISHLLKTQAITTNGVILENKYYKWGQIQDYLWEEKVTFITNEGDKIPFKKTTIFNKEELNKMMEN